MKLVELTPEEAKTVVKALQAYAVSRKPTKPGGAEKALAHSARRKVRGAEDSRIKEMVALLCDMRDALCRSADAQQSRISEAMSYASSIRAQMTKKREMVAGANALLAKIH